MITPMEVTTRVTEWRDQREADPRHDKRTASVLGVALGVSFTLCFVTGLASHLLQHRPSWFAWPTRPIWLYRVTQGMHVFSGIVSVPLLLAKLWSVAHQLVAPPKLRPLSGLVARVSLIPLVAGALFLLVSGIMNIDYWYGPFHFYFPAAHYAVAWITIGALIIHIGANATTVRAELSRNGHGDHGGRSSHGQSSRAPEAVRRRRHFLGFVAASSATLLITTIGETIPVAKRLALLAPRRPNVGPQGFPVNKAFHETGIDPASVEPATWRLQVTGKVAHPISLSLDELRAMPQRTASLPIACVEGWSVERSWTGVSVHDVLARAGVHGNPPAAVHSLQHSIYGTSLLTSDEVGDPLTLLALQVDGEVLAPDHGFPLRLIAPARPGVLQTKWLHEIEVR